MRPYFVGLSYFSVRSKKVSLDWGRTSEKQIQKTPGSCHVWQGHTWQRLERHGTWLQVLQDTCQPLCYVTPAWKSVRARTVDLSAYVQYVQFDKSFTKIKSRLSYQAPPCTVYVQILCRRVCFLHGVTVHTYISRVLQILYHICYADMIIDKRMYSKYLLMHIYKKAMSSLTAIHVFL